MGHDGQMLRAAIADLARYGCDLTDPSVDDGDRADDAAFHLGYLEDYCEAGLSVDDVLHAAHAMMRDTMTAHAAPHWR